MWKVTVFDGDGRTDVIVGVGDWTDYGWDNGYDAQGVWRKGPLRGFVYWVRNEGTNEVPKYRPAQRVQAAIVPPVFFSSPPAIRAGVSTASRWCVIG